MSVRYLPLLYDEIGGFWKIVFSKGWFCIKSQFSKSIFLRLHTDGWYVVTNGNPKICDAVIKGCFRRVCSKKSKGFSFYETFFHAWWVTWGKMCVLKGFTRLVMCSDIKDRFVSESFSFRYDCVEKCYFCLWDFSREFDCRVEVVNTQLVAKHIGKKVDFIDSCHLNIRTIGFFALAWVVLDKRYLIWCQF